MGRVKVNDSVWAVAVESTPETLPGTPTWYNLEVNQPNAFGPTTTTIPRAPITPDRNMRKGGVSDRDVDTGFETDLTGDMFELFIEGFMWKAFSGPATFVPTAATASGFTVAAGGDLVENTLVYTRGFVETANNGLFAVESGSTTTNIAITGLTAEASPPAKVKLEVCGFQGTTGDIEIDSNGDLITTTLDLTTLSLSVGQIIKIGGGTAGTQFATSANNTYGRIKSIAANLIELEHTHTTLAEDDGAGKTIQLLFGRFLNNSSTTAKTYTFENTLVGLGSSNETEYEYTKGNYANQFTLSLPSSEKATVAWEFIGLGWDSPSTTRKSEAENAIDPAKTAAFYTSTDMVRLRVAQTDDTGITTDFKNLTLTVNNDINREKVVGTLGAKYITEQLFNVSFEAEALFTSKELVTEITNNATLTADFVVKNGDGGIAFDIPSLYLGNGQRSFATGETVSINLTGTAFKDDTLGTSLGISLFPYLPD